LANRPYFERVTIDNGAIQDFRTAKVVAGGDSSCVIAGDDRVPRDAYGFGSNRDGQLGKPGTPSSAVPFRIEAVAEPAARFVGAAIADNHGHYLDELGRVFASGKNRYGQLGNGENTSRISLQEVFTLTPVTTSTATTTKTTVTITTVTTTITTLTTTSTNESDVTTSRGTREDEETDWTLIGWSVGAAVTLLALAIGFIAQGQAAKYAMAEDAEGMEMMRNDVMDSA